jgi:hypothetical protein
MTAEIVNLAARRSAAADDTDPPRWENTERGHAAYLLKLAIHKLERDNIVEAFGHVRAAHRALEKLDTEGITLAQELWEQERRRKRMERGAKAAATRMRNKAARLAAQDAD